MTKIPNRRRDRLLRETIKEYRRMSDGAQKDAASCEDAVVKERYLAVAKSLTELADALQGRASNEAAP
jgi:histone H3/H4